MAISFLNSLFSSEPKKGVQWRDEATSKELESVRIISARPDREHTSEGLSKKILLVASSATLIASLILGSPFFTVSSAAFTGYMVLKSSISPSKNMPYSEIIKAIAFSILCGYAGIKL